MSNFNHEKYKDIISDIKNLVKNLEEANESNYTSLNI